MGIFNTASEMSGNNQPPAGGSEIRLLQAALSLLADNGQSGGLQGLMERFQEAGLGNTISSWIGGDKVPITAEQVQQALGDGQLQQISEESGLSQNDTADRLSELLPMLVDQLTPAGRMPQGGLGDVSTLLQRFLGR